MRVFADGSLYCFSRERIWDAQLLLSSTASWQTMKSFMTTAGGQLGFTSSTDPRRPRHCLRISALTGRIPLRWCIAQYYYNIQFSLIFSIIVYIFCCYQSYLIIYCYILTFYFLLSTEQTISVRNYSSWSQPQTVNWDGSRTDE